MTGLRVILGVPHDESAELDYARGLAVSLAELGATCEILVTGPSDGSDGVTSTATGICVRRIPARLSDGLAEYWLEAIRFLEERAPCLFLCCPSGPADWVYPRLSSRIMVVPLLHHDDRTAYEYCRRLGGSFDAVFPLNTSLRQRLIADFSDLAPRIAGLDITPQDFPSVAKACVALVEKVGERLHSMPYLRKQGAIAVPPVLPSCVDDRKSVEAAVRFVNWKPRWPDPVSSVAASAGPAVVRSERQVSLREVRIVAGLTSGRISGVDIFSVNLVRELNRLGCRAEVLQTMADSHTSDSLPAASDIPVSRLQVPEVATWPQRWATLKAWLEREPTIYVPNYDERHSAIVPTLQPHVRVVGIAHSDDPHYYRHILRLAPYWDAVIAVSNAIAGHLADLHPGLDARMSVIPYGVRVPEDFSVAPREGSDPLRVMYAGRIVQYQKRVFDLLRIIQGSEERGLNVKFTIAGSGEDLGAFDQRAANALSHRPDFRGSLPNDEILKMLAMSHAFVLPSSFEGLPVSVLEAMANGCVPVVAAIRSGVRELIEDGSNGFLFETGDTRMAVDALERLSSDEKLRRSMSRAAYERVISRYGIEQMTGAYVEMFERVLASKYERPAGRISPPPSIHALDANMPPFPLPVRKLIAATREMRHGSG